MILSSSEALQIARNPTNQPQVARGRSYESRLRILTQAYTLTEIEKQTAWLEIKRYLWDILTVEKYDAIIKYFTFPLSVVNVTNDILTDLFFVFHGRNASFEIEMPNDNPRGEAIIDDMLSGLNIRSWIEDKGKEVLKCSPNSVVVVDLDDNGKPVLLLVNNEKLKGYHFTESGAFHYVVFEHSNGKDSNGNIWQKVAVYDDAFYRVYLVDNGKYTLETESPHNLGYCPAYFFYNKPLNSKLEFNRCVPLSLTTGILSEWAIFEAFIYYANHYSAFPIMEYADNGCNVQGCEGGIIASVPIRGAGDSIVGNTTPSECPSCAKKGLIGPGTTMGIEVSEDANIQDTRGVLRFVVNDVTSLEHLGKYQDIKKDFVLMSTIGYSNVITKDAVNEVQIRALMQSRMKPLLDIKKHLECLYKWIAKTATKLAHDIDIEVSANYGTEFFILTESDLLILIQDAKKAGVQSSEIAELNKMLIQTKYKNDPYKAQKMDIAADLEPSPYDTREEVKDKFLSGMISPEDYYLKLNFIDLLARFEREDGSIVDFGSGMIYSKKIDTIKSVLYSYIKPILKNENKQVPGGGNGVTDTQHA
jgi:hypothetical protein